MKKFLSIMLVVIMSTVLCCCNKPLDWKYIPSYQDEDTKWISSDGIFEIYFKGVLFYGYMEIDSSKIKIQGLIGNDGQFKVYAYSDYRLPNNFYELSESEQDSCIVEYDEKNRIEYESGQGRYRKNSFTITFDKTTYLESGAKIKFNKVE